MQEAPLLRYYRQCYPFRTIVRCYSVPRLYAPPGDVTSDFARREIALIVPSDTNKNGEFWRWQHFPSVEVWRKKVAPSWRHGRQNRTWAPMRMEIGSAYPLDMETVRENKDLRPKDRIKPYARELVFDIDVSDYDDIRGCGCREKQMCNTCWFLAATGARITNAFLRRAYGYEHMMTVYSGRRGIHVWCVDDNAVFLSVEARTDLVNRFHDLVKNGTDGTPFTHKLYMDFVGPAFQRILASGLEPFYYTSVVPENAETRYKKPDGRNLLWSCIESEGLRTSLADKWRLREQKARKQGNKRDFDEMSRVPPPFTETSTQLVEYVRDYLGADSAEWKKLEQRLAFATCFPRLDRSVTTDMKHLIKLPFCVHPSTRRVCIPIDIDDEQWTPDMAPTLDELTANTYAHQACPAFNAAVKRLEAFTERVFAHRSDSRNRFAAFVQGMRTCRGQFDDMLAEDGDEMASDLPVIRLVPQ